MAFAQSLLRKMLSDSLPEKHYDIFFVVRSAMRDGTRSETRLGAHRVVLSAVSPKFESNITFTTTTSTNTNTNTHPNASTTPSAPDTADYPNNNAPSQAVIYIDHCTTAAVREALGIIYGGELKEAKHCVSLALDIWKFGCLFQVDHLVSLARASCLSNLSTENCLRILNFAVLVKDTQIVDKLHEYAAQTDHFAHVVSSPDFEKLDLQVVRSLIRPGNGECAWPEVLTFEKVWFDALVRWLAPRVISQSSTSPQSINGQSLKSRQQSMQIAVATADGGNGTTEGGDREQRRRRRRTSDKSVQKDNNVSVNASASASASASGGSDGMGGMDVDGEGKGDGKGEDQDDGDTEYEDVNDGDEYAGASMSDVGGTARMMANIRKLRCQLDDVDSDGVQLIEDILSLVEFARLKTHELRDVSRNRIACLSPTFAHALVDILLSRNERLEATVLERNIDLDVIGQKYQQALCEQDEAERKARAALDKMEKLQGVKLNLEKRLEDVRRSKQKHAGASATVMTSSDQHSMGAGGSHHSHSHSHSHSQGHGHGGMATGMGMGMGTGVGMGVGSQLSNSLNSARRKMSGTTTII